MFRIYTRQLIDNRDNVILETINSTFSARPLLSIVARHKTASHVMNPGYFRQITLKCMKQ